MAADKLQPTSGRLIMPDGSVVSPADVRPIPGTAHGHPLPPQELRDWQPGDPTSEDGMIPFRH